MLFFEFLPGYAALLLFLPFLLLRRQQRPRKHLVGGVEPFLAASSSGKFQERKRPISFWLFLLAYLGAATALVFGRGMKPENIFLEDQSVSVLRSLVEAPLDKANRVVVGSVRQSVQQSDVLQVIQGLPNSPNVTVWTDLPSPNHLPAWIEWNNQAFSGQEEILGVILSAQPISTTQWRVHWAKQATVFASLQSGTWQSEVLVGEMGSTLVTVADPRVGIHLIPAGELVTSAAPGRSWALPEVRIQLPQGANLAWQAAALAAWPSASLTFGSNFELEINRQGKVVRELDDSIPWHDEPSPGDVARVAQVVRASLTAANPPRDSREYLPQSPINASRFNFSETRGLVPPQIAPWIVCVVLIAASCVAFAWVIMARQGEEITD